MAAVAGGCTSTDSSVTRLAGPSSLTRTSGVFTCAGLVDATLTTDLVVAGGDRCDVRATVRGNVTVEGSLVLGEGGRVEGNIDVREGGTLSAGENLVTGNIESRAHLALAGTRVEGNVIYRGAGTLHFVARSTQVKGNLDIRAPTVVSGAGDAAIDGNAQCRGHVIDRHTGRITTTGNKQNCPESF